MGGCSGVSGMGRVDVFLLGFARSVGAIEAGQSVHFTVVDILGKAFVLYNIPPRTYMPL